MVPLARIKLNCVSLPCLIRGGRTQRSQCLETAPDGMNIGQAHKLDLTILVVFCNNNHKTSALTDNVNKSALKVLRENRN